MTFPQPAPNMSNTSNTSTHSPPPHLRGWFLALLLLGWAGAILLATHGLAGLLLGALDTGLVLVADARGLITLNRLLPWQRIHGPARALLCLGFVLLLPLAVTIYLAQATRRYILARQIQAASAAEGAVEGAAASPRANAPPSAKPAQQAPADEPVVRQVPVLSPPAPSVTTPPAAVSTPLSSVASAKPTPPIHPSAEPAGGVRPDELPTLPQEAWLAPETVPLRGARGTGRGARVALAAGVLLALVLLVSGALLAFTGVGDYTLRVFAPASAQTTSGNTSTATAAATATSAVPGGPSAQPTATATPATFPATTPTAQAAPAPAAILEAAQSAGIHDARFALSVQTSIAGMPTTGSGSGAFTMQPERSRCDLDAVTSGQHFSLSVIADASSGAVFARLSGISLPNFPNERWQRISPGLVGLVGVPQLGDYAALGNPALVGPDEVDGVAVWHLRGVAPGVADTMEDLYVRQDNNVPVAMTLTATGVAPAQVRVDFTAFNIGLNISLPY